MELYGKGFSEQKKSQISCSLMKKTFNPFRNKSSENTVGNGEIACNEQFLLFTPCFLPFLSTFHHFHQNLNCCLQTLSVWNSVKFFVLERVMV